MFYFSMVLISSAISYLISTKRRLRFGFTKKQSAILILAWFICGLLGAKLLYCIENPKEPLTFAGLSFFGTVLFIPFGLFVAAKSMKLNYGKVLDFAGIYVPLVLAFTRIGCFRAGCCGAVPILLQSGKTVTPPIQLIESALDLITFLALLGWDRGGMVRFYGEQYPKFVIMYSFIRMIMEHYRDTPKFLFGMSEGQWFCVSCFAASIIILTLITKSGLKKQAKEGKTPKKK